MSPGDIAKECFNDATRQHARDNYLKTQDVEAQLVAAGLADIKHAFYYLIWTLEKKHDPNEAEDKALEPDFLIPAVTCWIKHTGKKLYESLSKDKIKNWNRRDISHVAKHFDQHIERWSFWEKRLIEVAKDGGLDDFIRNEAELALRYMQDITDALEKI